MLLESKLITALSSWGAIDKWHGRQVRIIDFDSFVAQVVMMPMETTSSPIIQARVNHGRWIGDCPFCAGAEFVWFQTPSWFFCLSCRNEKAGGKWLPINVPTNYQKIEKLLSIRPRQNQNWEPGETLAQIKRENKEYGIA